MKRFQRGVIEDDWRCTFEHDRVFDRTNRVDIEPYCDVTFNLVVEGLPREKADQFSDDLRRWVLSRRFEFQQNGVVRLLDRLSAVGPGAVAPLAHGCQGGFVEQSGWIALENRHIGGLTLGVDAKMQFDRPFGPIRGVWVVRQRPIHWSRRYALSVRARRANERCNEQESQKGTTHVHSQAVRRRRLYV